jgi:LDH2 family malate/lactate/ureidoglycolate dehydrogenase
MAERLVTAEWLGDLVARIFRALDVPDDDAAIIADHMVHAELRDVRSHGVSRVRVYAERLQAGLVHPCARLRVLRETPVSVHLDGGNGPGPVVAQRAMDRVIEKAREVGIGVGAVRGSNHCGMLAHYTTRALAHGLIGVATTSAPANMPLWGGRERYLGTNPLSYAIPTGAEIDIVFDMATSWVARGKILIAAAAASMPHAGVATASRSPMPSTTTSPPSPATSPSPYEGPPQLC